MKLDQLLALAEKFEKSVREDDFSVVGCARGKIYDYENNTIPTLYTWP